MAVDVGAELDAWTARVLPLLTPLERNVLRRWQGRDRYYSRIQAYLRGADSSDPELSEDVDVLTSLFDREEFQLPFDVPVWRGVRSGDKMFPNTPPPVGARKVNDGLFATTIYRDIAVTEFLTPPGGGGCVLLSLNVPTGLPAIWMPVVGDPDEARQGELLLQDRLELVVIDVSPTDTPWDVRLKIETS